MFLPVLAVRPASWRFFGVPFWTPRVFWILLGPSEAFFLGREAARVFCASLALFFFFPVSLCFAAVFSHALEGADPSSNVAYPRVIEPAPRPSEGPGSAIVRGRLDTAFRDTFFALTCLAEGHRDPLGLFLWGGGAFSAPSGPFSHALVFVSPPQVFFFWVAFEAKLVRRIAWTLRVRSEYGISNSDSCPKNTPEISEESR